MKRTLLFIACVLTSITMQAHAEGEYESLLSEGKTWTMSYRSPYQEGKVSYVESKLEGDTIIGNVTFKRKYDRDWKQGDATPHEWKATDYYVGEDGGKVYYYFKALNDEPQLLMDFSAQVDDVIPVQIEGMPSSIKVVNVNNTIFGSSTDQTLRRCLDVKDTWHDRSDTWIEGIGSMAFGIENYFMNMLTGGIPMLIKCQYNGQTLYEDDAQEEQNDYIPFLEEGKILRVVSSASSNIQNYSFLIYLMNEIEERNGKTYFKVRCGMNALTEHYVGLFREENRRVYKYDEVGGRDILLYDFSLKEGDTFTYEFDFEPVKCKVLKQGWLDDGPQIVSSVTRISADSVTVKHRRLRIWTIGCEDGWGGYREIMTWVEGVGVLGDMFCPFCRGGINSLAYIKRTVGYLEYLPFSFYNMFGLVHGCNIPKSAERSGGDENGRHKLIYELEGDRLHVYGDIYAQGDNEYAYFIEEKTDDPLVRKLHFQIEAVDPVPTGWPYSTIKYFYATDFYVPGFDPNMSYIVVENQGAEHQVINKTPQMAYRPFIEDGKVWVVKGNGISPDGSPIEPWINYCYLDGDTIIGGQTCKRMMCVTDDNPSQQYVGAWYEQDKKVYFAGNYGQQFELLYDFTLSSGDSIQSPVGDLWTVNKLSGGITGFKGTYYDFYNNDNVMERWFEGVGSESWPFINHPEYLDGNKGVLLACFVGDEVIYYNSEEDDPYYMGARKRRFDFTHTIKTNPSARMRRGAEQSLLTSAMRHPIRACAC